MQHLIDKAKKIKLALFDVDGVLTNGILTYGHTGTELKGFNVQDGVGLKLLQQAGIEIGIITAHQSEVVTQRMNHLKINHIYQGSINKLPAYEDIKKKLNLTDEQISYMGDDLPDLPLLRRAGFSITVKNSAPFIKDYVDWTTQKKGGRGAVREACEFILNAQGLYQQLLQAYLSE